MGHKGPIPGQKQACSGETPEHSERESLPGAQEREKLAWLWVTSVPKANAGDSESQEEQSHRGTRKVTTAGQCSSSLGK